MEGDWGEGGKEMEGREGDGRRADVWKTGKDVRNLGIPQGDLLVRFQKNYHGLPENKTSRASLRQPPGSS